MPQPLGGGQGIRDRDHPRPGASFSSFTFSSGGNSSSHHSSHQPHGLSHVVRVSRPQNLVSEIKADPSLISNLMEMGFSKSQCKAALKKTNNNFEKSLDKLLENGEQFIGLENSDDSDGDGGGAGQSEDALL